MDEEPQREEDVETALEYCLRPPLPEINNASPPVHACPRGSTLSIYLPSNLVKKCFIPSDALKNKLLEILSNH